MPRVVLEREPSKPNLVFDDVTQRRANQRADSLAFLHHAKIEEQPDGSLVVKAADYYNK